MNSKKSFAMLDRENGLPEYPPAVEEEFPLPAWYRAVREIPLDELGIEDIAKASRQQIHLDHVIPIAIRILQADPLAGEMYDGELLASLKPVPASYWSSHPSDASALKGVIGKVLQIEATNDDVRQAAKDLLNRVT